MGLFNFRRPILMIVLINIAGYGILSFFGQTFEMEMVYIGLAVVSILCVSYFIVSRMSVEDEYIFLIVAMLFSLGEIMLYRLDSYFGQKQLVWLAVSMLFFFIVYFLILRFRIWERLHYLYFAGAIGLFLLTMLLGTSVSGSKNWIIIGDYSFQPSEIVKLLVVFILADRYAHPEKYRIWKLSEGIVCSVMIYMILGCMVIQKEWGTAVVIFLLHLSMMFVFGEKWYIIAANVVLAVLGALGGFLFVSHIKVRVDTWLNPWDDMAGKGYQITQSLFAIGAGGFFGTGIGLGSPEYIPEVHSDFIFSAICEEFGILGGVAVIMLYFLLVYRGIRIAMKLENKFYKCLAAGVSILIGFQTFIILGGVTKMIPLTGITLPFISYGGSSLLASFIAIGVLEAAANKKNVVEKEAVIDEEK